MTLNMPLDKVVERIVAETNLSKEEVLQRIDEKVAELGGLITPEGAAHIIARELEINLYDSHQVQPPHPTTISELIAGMNNITITTMIRNVYDSKEFTKKDGAKGAVQNINLVDKTGSCRLVLWDDQIRQFKEMGLSRADIIKIMGAYVRENKYDGIKELGLNFRSKIDPSPEDVDSADFPKSLLSSAKISELTLGLNDVEIVGKVTAIRPPSNFTKKDGSEGQVASLEIADETGKIRITLWDAEAETVTRFKVGDVISLIGGYTRQGINNSIEIHLGRHGSIDKDPKTELDVPKEILESNGTLFPLSTTSSDSSEEVRLADLNDSMNNISIIARITGISSIREFTRGDGTTSVVGSLLVKDNSGPGRVTLWNSMTDYIKQVEIGDVIRIKGAYVKLGLRGEPEVHVGNRTVVEINPEYLKDAVPELDLEFTDLAALEAGQRDVNVRALVLRVQELRIFAKSDGTEGRVLNIGISDLSGSSMLVAWDEHAIDLEDLEEMTRIEVLHGYTKAGNQGVEVHLGRLSTVRRLKDSEAPELAKVSSIASSRKAGAAAKRVDMIDLEDGHFSEIRGTILKVYEGKMYYHSCPECRKKVTENEEGNWHCNEHGLVEPEQSLFISVALDDGTGCVRVTFFRELAEQLIDLSSKSIIDDIEQVGVQSVIAKLEQRVKGREIVVQGRARKNKFDDGMDLVASAFFEVDPKSEIELMKSSLNV